MITKEIITQSIDYMLCHIGEEMTVRDVADHFHYSEYYFSRAFKSATGESVYAFIKHLKMDQSAIDVKLKTDKSITDIGLDYGYTASNYSSAFKLHHHVSPSEFRESSGKDGASNPFEPETTHVFERFEAYHSKIKIERLADMRVLYERVIGTYAELKASWLRFFNTYAEYIHEETTVLERFYDDPAITAFQHCMCDLCATVGDDCTLENTMTIKGGTFAIYRFEGHIKEIFCALQGVFSVWLPNSGYEMDERYGLNIYRKIEPETDFVIMDLCIPVQ